MRSMSNSMKLCVIEMHGGAVYATIKALSEKYGMCRATVRKRVTELESEVGRRYDKTMSILDDGHTKLVNEFVFLDWLANRNKLQDSNARRYVEPFSASAWSRYMGFYQMILGEDKDEKKDEERAD